MNNKKKKNNSKLTDITINTKTDKRNIKTAEFFKSLENFRWLENVLIQNGSDLQPQTDILRQN